MEFNLVWLCKMNWSSGKTMRSAKRLLQYYRGQENKPKNGGNDILNGKAKAG